MWQPVSNVVYQIANPAAQLLVCTDNALETALPKWKDRAAAVFAFRESDTVLDVIRDILANPQIRAIVFDNASSARERFNHVWADGPGDLQGIEGQHIDAVRQYVDLYDNDCIIRKALQPFWPKRLCYRVDR